MEKIISKRENGRIFCSQRQLNGSVEMTEISPKSPLYPQWLSDWEAFNALEKTPLTPPTGPFVAPYELPVDSLPSGTSVFVWIESGECIPVLDLSDGVLLNYPGNYIVVAEPPLPYLEYIAEIEVTV